MSKIKPWPVYVSVQPDGGCGHQHQSARRAYNCGGGRTVIEQVKPSKQTVSGITRKIIYRPGTN